MVDQTDPAIMEVQQKNKALEFEMKKKMRKEIQDFSETASFGQLTEIYCEIKRLRGLYMEK